MRVGVIQSNYIPWRGYFDLMASVDLFVVYDDVQYSKNTWRNRNRLKTPDGLRWLTVPVQASLSQRIDEVQCATGPWRDEHRRLLILALGAAPFFKDARRLWEEGVADSDPGLSTMNVRLLRLICGYLGIETPIVMSRQYEPSGRATERLLDLLQKVGATHYLSGPSARDYLDERLFREKAIVLEYKSYDYASYPQQGAGFAGEVSVLDLIANVGRDAPQHVRSRTPDLVAHP